MPLSSLGLGGTSLIGGAVSGIGSIFGAGKSANAATQAAKIQAQAAEAAVAAQMSMYNQTAARLAPWVQTGQQAQSKLSDLTGLSAGLNPLTAPLTQRPTTWGMQNEFSPTMAALEQTPGYQFTRQQGLQATTNAYAAQGLGGSITGARASPSGPLGAGLEQFATGLASNTFNQQYQNWLAGQGFQQGANLQAYNILAGQSGQGQNAAANTGQFGSAAVQGANQALMGGAAASAAGVVGAANAWNQGLGAAGSSVGNAFMMSALLNQPGMFGNPQTGTGLAAGPGPGTGGLY